MGEIVSKIKLGLFYQVSVSQSLIDCLARLCAPALEEKKDVQHSFVAGRGAGITKNLSSNRFRTIHVTSYLGNVETKVCVSLYT
jgi:hypothetical protein